MAKMRVNILVNHVGNGWEPTDQRLGGTEEAVVKWAEEFAKLGHEVIVYRNGYDPERGYTYKGVNYEERNLYGEHGGDVCINVKSSGIAPIEPTIYFTNETNASDLDLSKYDAVVWPSQWCVDNIPVNNDKVYVVPHGYDETAIYPEKKQRKQCFYASSPDRGLDTLLEIWPQVTKVHKDALLLVTYGAQLQTLPKDVILLGNLDEESMNEIYRTSEYWLHPANGGELFCITGLKAQAAGCWPVIIPTMALAETVKFGTKTDKEHYAQAVIEALNESPVIPEVSLPTYKDSADELMQIISKVIS